MSVDYELSMDEARDLHELLIIAKHGCKEAGREEMASTARYLQQGLERAMEQPQEGGA